MARAALPRIGALEKLPVVYVLMAIHAFGENQLLFEIAIGMACGAIYRLMFSFQGEFSLGMVETLIDLLQRNSLPSHGTVAGFTPLREAAVMRVLVAFGTLIEGNADVPWLAVRSICVTLGALHLRVEPGQWISRFGVIELSDIDLLPVNKVVAGSAVLSEAALVLILMTRNACG